MAEQHGRFKNLRINDVAFSADGRIGYASGEHSVLCISTDSGITWQSGTIETMPPTESIYSLAVKPSGRGVGTGSTGLFYEYTPAFADVSEQPRAISLAAYPNPATTEFTVTGAQGMVSLYDLQGVRVERVNANPSCRMSVATLANGFYYLRFTRADGSSASLPIVIQH